MSQRKTGAIAPWAQEEMATAQLNDKRLNQRLTQILSDLGDRPTASIPAACGEPTEMTGAYRFFDNAKVTPAAVLEPHFAATQQRLAEEPVVLLGPQARYIAFGNPLMGRMPHCSTHL